MENKSCQNCVYIKFVDGKDGEVPLCSEYNNGRASILKDGCCPRYLEKKGFGVCEEK